ncbi:unnamed protein product [Calypogeia fissa]
MPSQPISQPALAPAAGSKFPLVESDVICSGHLTRAAPPGLAWPSRQRPAPIREASWMLPTQGPARQNINAKGEGTLLLVRTGKASWSALDSENLGGERPSSASKAREAGG